MSKYSEMATALRVLSAETIDKAKSGHPGLPLGMADVMTVLWNDFLNFDPMNHKWLNRDRFVLSAGHGSAMLYSLLFLSGYKDITMEDMKNFRQFKSKTAGHPEYGHITGIETTTGPLGQGIATATGMALGERILNAKFGNDLINNKTYTLVGDGCLMEGISEEAIDFAGRQKLANLVVLWDNNNITIEGEVGMASSVDQVARFKACQWNVIEIDGHDYDQINDALTQAQSSTKPTMIACKTIIGKGAPTKSGSSKVHGAPLGEVELNGMKEALGWIEQPFTIPADTLKLWRNTAERGQETCKKWQDTFSKQSAEVQKLVNDTAERRIPENFTSDVNDFKKKHTEEGTKVASRQASNMILEVINTTLPFMIGGSADLTPSNLTKTSNQQYTVPENGYKGTYIDYGIREHLMGAIMNGLVLSGVGIPYGGAFMVFADYARPAQRLASLMGIAPIFVLTHDSIGVGEDGPTHQPVETLVSMRSMPNFHIYRPADIIETAECWKLAVESKKTPSALALTRQALPLVRTHHTDDNLSAKGGYILRGEENASSRQITIIATGSEVSLAVETFDQLTKDGVKAVVVSMPCTSIFDAQSDSYKSSILGDNSKPRVAIEAGISYGWDKYLGFNGKFIGMTGFGASAPANQLFEHFGITTENLLKTVKELI